VRWDRLGRIAMLCVMAALVYLYLSAGLSLLSSWQESHRADAQLAGLERQHRVLQVQGTSLKSPGTVEAEARLLGMAYPGERVYIVPGLPKN
jgi:cell division protein FtsB